MKKPTVTIGIPAYNEEANIEYLLKTLLADSSRIVKLAEIVIVSDGSTDATVTCARSVNDRRIRIIDRKQRRGLVATENELLRNVHGDILVMLDADVVPVESDFLDRITEPIRKNSSVGCVGADIIPLPPRNLFERVIANSHYLKRHLYRRISHGNNVYLCHGRARAFSRSFYKKLHWPDDCPEDAFSYLTCIARGFKFKYTDAASIFFRSPVILFEHRLQSSRFVAGIDRLKELFSPEFVKREYSIPWKLFVGTLLKYLFRNPFSTPAYLVITSYIRLTHRNTDIYKSRFEVASTSKQIVAF